MVEPPTPTSEPYLLDMPSTVERARMRRDATERVARDHADEATSLRIDLEEARLVQSWQGGRIDGLARELREVKASLAAAVEVAAAGALSGGALAHLRDVFGMVPDEPPLTALARIREEAAAVERARWCEALGLSSMDAAKAYIAKIEGELEATGKPTPHQPAGGGGGGAGATVVMAADAPKPAGEPDKAAADGKRKATPRADRVTTVELAKAVRAASDEAKATGGKIQDLALVFEPFVGRTVVKAKAKGADHDAASAGEVVLTTAIEAPAPGMTAGVAPAPIRWEALEFGHRLVVERTGAGEPVELARLVSYPTDADRKELTTILGPDTTWAPESKPDQRPSRLPIDRFDTRAHGYAEDLVVASLANVINLLTGALVRLDDGSTPPGAVPGRVV